LTPPDPKLPIDERRLVPRWFLNPQVQNPVSKRAFHMGQLALATARRRRVQFDDERHEGRWGAGHKLTNSVDP